MNGSRSKSKRPRKSLRQLAWDWCKRRVPDDDFATFSDIEEAFIAGVRYERRRKRK